jgi:hypothetical protein
MTETDPVSERLCIPDIPQSTKNAQYNIRIMNQPLQQTFRGSEVLTAVVMKSIIFWDITPCSPLSVNRRFGGTYRLHLQGRKSKPEDGGDMFLRNIG